MATLKSKKGHAPCTDAASTLGVDNTPLVLRESRGESLVDSRIIAAHLGVQHESSMRSITEYADDFKALGILRFEIGEIAGRGQPERFALLSEDQCYLLLAYSRNTDRVRALKLKLVLAFRESRERRALTDTAYLPGYYALHDEVMALARLAHDHGSVAGDEVFHCNANKLVNKAAGIEAGMRDQLTSSQRLMVINLQAVIRNTIHRAISAGADHKAAYQQAKDAALSFASMAGHLLGGV